MEDHCCQVFVVFLSAFCTAVFCKLHSEVITFTSELLIMSNILKNNFSQILVIIVTIILAIIVTLIFNGQIKRIDEKLQKTVPSNDTLTINTVKKTFISQSPPYLPSVYNTSSIATAADV